MELPTVKGLDTMRKKYPLTTFIASIVPYEAFPTADGDILLGGGNDKLYGILCSRLGKDWWATDPRFETNAKRVKHRDILVPMIAEETKKKATKVGFIKV